MPSLAQSLHVRQSPGSACKLLSFCFLLFDNEFGTIKTNNLLLKTIHAVNAAPWQPGEETQTLQTNKQTNGLL